MVVIPSQLLDHDMAASRPRKRIRPDPSVAQPLTKSTPREPRLFAPFRALGLITNHIPFILQTRSHKGSTDGPRTHIMTCLGKAWALWEGSKMSLLFVGKIAHQDSQNELVSQILLIYERSIRP